MIRSTSSRPRLVFASLSTLAILASGCSASTTTPESSATTAATPDVALTSNVADRATDVGVDTLVSVEAADGSVTAAVLASSDDETTIDGEVADGVWTAQDRLEPATEYTLTAEGENADGTAKTMTSSFTTQQLTLDQQTYPAVAPLAGETVGVGMPVIVTFDIPVKDKALFEENMHVTSSKDVEGSWSWLSDQEVHYRPKEYWPANTDVSVDVDVNGLPAGNGIFGQQDQTIDFTVGRAAISTVDVDNHTLTYTRDGETVKTLPVTSGDATHQTRQGTKIVMEKFDSVDMDAASTGVDADAPDYYNIEGVKWAMRLTNSGEFLHAAPWSVGSQGSVNVSHGCTGMSTENAGWLYNNSIRGDVVTYVDSPRSLEDRNGWTDWNVNWDTWTQGSALDNDGTA